MTISNQASGIRPGVCSSTTRPTAPFTGQIIYETDTGYLRVWDGSNWDYLSQKQDTAQGFPAGDKLINYLTPAHAFDGAFRSVSGGAANWYPLTTLSVTATTGTNALIIMQCLATHSIDNAGVGVTFSVSGATTFTAGQIGGTFQAYGTIAGAGGYQSLSPTFYMTNLTAGSNTFTFNHYYIGSGTAQYGFRQLMVFPLP